MMYDVQRASMWKRISVFLFDAILLGVAVVLCAWLLSAVVGFDRHNDALNACYAKYEAQFGVQFQQTLAEYQSMDEAQAQNLDAAYAALAQDSEAVYAYDMVIQLTLLITSLGILLGYLALEFAVPLLLGNGQTLGKKIFGIGLMRTDGVKINTLCLFIRVFLGKYTLETMIPVLLVMMIALGSLGLLGTLLLGLILLVQLVLLFSTRNHSLIHDLLAATVAVDLASQMIFDTKEALLAYKQKAHAEKIARQQYA